MSAPRLARAWARARYQTQTLRLSRSIRPTSCSTLRWWLMVGWDRSNAAVRSQTHASPPGWEAIRPQPGNQCHHSATTGTLKTGEPDRDSSVLRKNALVKRGALGGTRTPNLLIRSQMLYPLSYERGCRISLRHIEPRQRHQAPVRAHLVTLRGYC